VIYGALMVSLVGNQGGQRIDGSINFLDGFALFVASLVLFKFIFASIYVIEWNLRFCCNPAFKNNKIDVPTAFKKIRKDKNGAESSDEEDEFNGEGENTVIRETGASKIVDDYDEDDDDIEFDDADNEEEEDRIQDLLRSQ
jgi:hypothetical protein